MNKSIRQPDSLIQSRGAALITALIILLVLTVLGVTAMRNTSLQENITGNLRDRDLALQAAESALTDAEYKLSAAAVTNIPIPGGNLTIAGTTIGKVFQRGVLPAMNTTAHDSSVWNATNAIPVNTSLQGLSANPSYIVEFEQSVIDNLDPESRAKGRGNFYYRITARGVGNSPNSVVLLQEVYGIRSY